MHVECTAFLLYLLSQLKASSQSLINLNCHLPQNMFKEHSF